VTAVELRDRESFPRKSRQTDFKTVWELSKNYDGVGNPGTRRRETIRFEPFARFLGTDKVGVTRDRKATAVNDGQAYCRL
jgi:hypothetical protein